MCYLSIHSALQIEELREQLTTEKETAVEREREAARTRFEKQLKEELEALQSQRRRLLADVHDEKERLAQQSAKLRTDLDRVRNPHAIFGLLNFFR